MFKKQKKYKITLTEDELFILGPIVLMWIEDWKKEKKCNNNNNIDIEEFDNTCLKNGFRILSKIKEVREKMGTGKSFKRNIKRKKNK